MVQNSAQFVFSRDTNIPLTEHSQKVYNWNSEFLQSFFLQFWRMICEGLCNGTVFRWGLWEWQFLSVNLLNVALFGTNSDIALSRFPTESLTEISVRRVGGNLFARFFSPLFKFSWMQIFLWGRERGVRFMTLFSFLFSHSRRFFFCSQNVGWRKNQEIPKKLRLVEKITVARDFLLRQLHYHGVWKNFSSTFVL